MTRTTRATAALVAALLLPGLGHAQEVRSCDQGFEPDSIVEPWDQNSATFANGEIRVAVLDTIEPAAAAFQLLVLSPPRDEVGGRQCHIIGHDSGNGFGSVYFDKRTTSYDPTKGLTITVPVMPPGGGEEATYLKITVNQSTGEIQTSASHNP